MSKALNKTPTTFYFFLGTCPSTIPFSQSKQLDFHYLSVSFTVFTPPLRQVSSTSYHLQYLNLSQGYSFLPFQSISYPNLNQGLFGEKLHQVSTMAQIYPTISTRAASPNIFPLDPHGHSTTTTPWPPPMATTHGHHSTTTR